jgi:transposase
MGGVVIGVDPHKQSATIEVMDARERVRARGRYRTDRDGYAQMLAAGRRWPQRAWAVEGCNGIGRPVAQRLVADGEVVLDVPAKLSARVRVFSTGNGRKTDPDDAHSIAVVAMRPPGLAQVSPDGDLAALRLLADRRDELAHARTQTVRRLHRLLLQLIPGGAPRFLSALQAKAPLATVRPRDVAGRTRRHLVAELITEIAVLDRKLKASAPARCLHDRHSAPARRRRQRGAPHRTNDVDADQRRRTITTVEEAGLTKRGAMCVYVRTGRMPGERPWPDTYAHVDRSRQPFR